MSKAEMRAQAHLTRGRGHMGLAGASLISGALASAILVPAAPSTILALAGLTLSSIALFISLAERDFKHAISEA